MTNIEIGNRIKYARTLRDVTLEDIAKKVGVAKSTIQRYETGKISNVKLPVIESIGKALNINPAWIIGKSDDLNEPIPSSPQIIKYYNQLNDIGKLEATKRVKELTYLNQYVKNTNTYMVNAAHERTDIEITEEMKQYDEDIMDDENF